MSIENDIVSDRGFKAGRFIDNYGKKCSLQESSACASNGDEGWYIWLGLDEVEIHKGLATGPGTRVYLDDTHDVFSRMHLSQKRVAELIPHLQYFVETGYLPTPGQHDEFVKHLADKRVPDIINDFFAEVST